MTEPLPMSLTNHVPIIEATIEMAPINIGKNKTVGLFHLYIHHIGNCYVSDMKCNSEEEFQNLIKPYMEE